MIFEFLFKQKTKQNMYSVFVGNFKHKIMKIHNFSQRKLFCNKNKTTIQRLSHYLQLWMEKLWFPFNSYKSFDFSLLHVHKTFWYWTMKDNANATYREQHWSMRPRLPYVITIYNINKGNVGLSSSLFVQCHKDLCL